MMARCSACGARARKLRNAHVITGRRIKPGRVCNACERLGWLLVLGEDKPRPTTPRQLARQLSGARAAVDAFKRIAGPRFRCTERSPASGTHARAHDLRCELELEHAGKHCATVDGGKVVRWL